MGGGRGRFFGARGRACRIKGNRNGRKYDPEWSTGHKASPQGAATRDTENTEKGWGKEAHNSERC